MTNRKHQNTKSTPKTVLLTGGSSGIGFELSKLFRKDGHKLIIASLYQEEIDEAIEYLNGHFPDVAGESVEGIQIDLGLPNAAQTLHQEIQRRNHNIDVLVNCAGFGCFGEHTEIPLTKMQSMLTLNVQSLTLLCTLFGTEFKNRGSGFILNIGSTTSFQPVPFLAAYAGTKAFVVSFSEALAMEMKPHGVIVSCLCPGTTNTKFLSVAGLEQSSKFGSVGNVAYHIAMDPKDVAKVGYEGLFKQQVVSVPGVVNNAHYVASRLLPNKVISRVAQRFFSQSE